jgi:integrase
MALKQRGSHGTWWAYLTVNGQRVRQSLGTTDYAVAQQAHRALELSLLTGTPLPRSKAAVVAARDQWTLQKAFDHAMATHWAGDRSLSTVRSNFDAVLKSIPGDTPMADLTIEHLSKLVADQLAAGNCLTTANRKLAVVNKLLVLSRGWGKPTAMLKVPVSKEDNARSRTITDAEEQQMLTIASETGAPWFPDLIAVLLYTGCRLGEVLSLTPASLVGTSLTFEKTKNFTARTLPLTPAIAAAAARLVAAMPSREAVYYAWTEMKIAMGLKDDPEFVPHCCRHTCITRLVRRTGNLRLVQKWAGHKSIQSTLRYEHADTGDLCQLVPGAVPQVVPQPCLTSSSSLMGSVAGN